MLLLLIFTNQVSCVTDAVFSENDAKRISSLIVGKQQANGMWSTLPETDHAIFALKSLGSTIKKSKKICQKLSGALPKEIKFLYHTIRASKALGCADIDISSIQPTLQDAISGATINLEDAFYAWKVIMMTDTIGNYDFQTTIGLVVELMEDDGSFRDDTDSDDSSVINAGYAIEMVGEIYSKIEALQEPSLGIADELSELSDKVKEITDIEPTIGTDLSPLVATASVLNGLTALSNALQEQLDFDEEYVETVAQFFVSNKYVDNVIDSSFLLQGLTFCVDNSLYVPYSLINTDGLNIRVTDVKDQVLDDEIKVELMEASLLIPDSDSETVLSNIELTSAGDGNFHLKSNEWKNAKPGYYNLVYKIGDDEVIRSTKVIGKVTKTTFEVYTTDSLRDEVKGATQSSTYPKKLPGTFKLDKKCFVVKVKIESNVDPTQVFVQFAKGSRTSVFVAKASDDNDDYYTFNGEVESAAFYENIFGSGKYDISLIVGDALLEKSFSWSIGTFAIEISPEVQAAIEEPEDLFKQLPDIAHEFKKADERPPAVLALVFTVIVLLPLFWLLITVASHVKLKFPSSPIEFLSTMIFQATLAAFLALYALYWINLTIFQTLFGVGVLSTFAIFSGNKSLSLLHERMNKKKRD